MAALIARNAIGKAALFAAIGVALASGGFAATGCSTSTKTVTATIAVTYARTETVTRTVTKTVEVTREFQPPESLVPETPSPSPGDGATALCNDGTYSYAAHHQGACSWHGGVAVFYK